MMKNRMLLQKQFFSIVMCRGTWLLKEFGLSFSDFRAFGVIGLAMLLHVCLCLRVALKMIE